MEMKPPEKEVAVRLARLHARAQGIALGLILAGGIFIATNWLVIKGGETVGPHLGLLGQYFIGYDVTFLGSLVGAAYGFVLGFVIGYVITLLYNFFASRRDTRLP